MSANPETDPVHAAAMKAAQRLEEAISELEAGREVQPSKLNALAYLTLDYFRHGQQGHNAWRDFVLSDAAELLRSGQSLACSHFLPIDEKSTLLDRIRQCPTPKQFTDQRHPELEEILSYLYHRFPEHVHRHVHGTRWKVDPDILLIGCACRSLYAWKDMLTAYCIEYADYRLMLTPRSVPRLKHLLGRLQAEFL